MKGKNKRKPLEKDPSKTKPGDKVPWNMCID